MNYYGAKEAGAGEGGGAESLPYATVEGFQTASLLEPLKVPQMHHALPFLWVFACLDPPVNAYFPPTSFLPSQYLSILHNSGQVAPAPKRTCEPSFYSTKSYVISLLCVCGVPPFTHYPFIFTECLLYARHILAKHQ